jgi:Ribbon-helix-helix protein, copG family
MSETLTELRIDAATAAKLNARARARGVSVSDLLNELVEADATFDAADAASVRELDRRWAEAASEKTVANSDVAGWLNTWGTPAYRTWAKR